MLDYDAEKAEIYSDEMKIDVLSLKPMMFDLLQGIEGRKTLDFGCGSGRFSKVMAESGAQVLGVDISDAQIALAKKINSHENILYEVGSVSSLEGMKSSSFDLVLMNMILPSLDNKEIFGEILVRMARILRNDGRLIISFLHPLFLHPIQHVNDRATDFKFENYFEEGHYYSSEAITTKGRVMNFRETHFSLNFISETLERNGFCIKKIRESRLVPEAEANVPVYMAFECVKG